MYHRVISGALKTGRLRLLTLTSASETDNVNFQRDFRKLYMRLKRRGLLVDYVRCSEYTESGLRHDHVLFRGSYIEQVYLSRLWESLHGAKVIDIRGVKFARGMASYMAKYLSKSEGSRFSYSWGWVYRGFCGGWRALKKHSRQMGWSFKQLVDSWQYIILTNQRVCDLISGEV